MNQPAELPYAVKSTKVIWMIQNAPPPKPLCFDTLNDWQVYLMYLEASGEKITRRQDLGKHSATRVRTVTTIFDRIDYCADCHIGGERQQRMQATGRCILPSSVAQADPEPPRAKGTRQIVAERRARIWASFDGRNHLDLASRFYLSMRSVYRALQIMRRAYIRMVQRDLFDDCGAVA